MKTQHTSKAAPAVRQLWTAQANRLARAENGQQSQVALATAAGVPVYVIKQFEAGRFRPLPEHVAAMRSYFEAQGLDLEAITSDAADDGERAGHAAALPSGFTNSPRPGFFISDKIAPELVAKVMDRMGANDDRIAELTAEGFQAGFFGGITEDTEAKARELIGTLAESYIAFRFLQGRSIVSSGSDEPQTIGDYLGQMLSASPMLPLIAGEPAKVSTPEAAASEA